MPREAEPSLNEKQFVLQALKENLRQDGREFDAYRPLDLAFGDDYGHADVKLGKTRYANISDSIELRARADSSTESSPKPPPR